MIFSVDCFKIWRTFIVLCSALPLPVSKCRRIITLQFIGAWMSLASLMCFTILTFSASSIYLSRPLKTPDVLLSVITHLVLFCCFKVSNGAHKRPGNFSRLAVFHEDNQSLVSRRSFCRDWAHILLVRVQTFVRQMIHWNVRFISCFSNYVYWKLQACFNYIIPCTVRHLRSILIPKRTRVNTYKRILFFQRNELLILLRTLSLHNNSEYEF